MVAAALHRYPYGTSARTMLYIAPAACFLAGAGVAALIGRTAPGEAAAGPAILIASLMCLYPAISMGVDYLLPYQFRDDLHNRALVRKLADLARPGDRWIVFNGATPPPPMPDLMTQRWMQQVAEVRYYITLRAPCPISWEPDPERVEAPRGPGRTFLLVHQPARLDYPHDRLARYREALARVLGRPRVTRYESESPGEYIDLGEYPAGATR